MKRGHAAAFGIDALRKLPKECELLVVGFLTVVDLCGGLAPTSSRFRDLVYESKNWQKIRVTGLSNQRVLSIVGLHGRKMKSLSLYGMRVSRALCRIFSKCTRLQSLDLTGIWKSPAVDKRFVAAVSTLPLKRLLFGQNELCDEGFDLICKSMPTLEELDFNSRRVSARSLYAVCMLRNLESLCLRSCSKANEDVVRSVCRLPALKTLQLSFLPMVHCSSLRHLYGQEYGILERLETLVLNGMYIDKERLRALSGMRKLRTLSLCHPKVNSRDLEGLCLPTLELLTVFCANDLATFDFLGNLPSLRTLCLYRCACSNRSLMQWARKRPEMTVRIFASRPLRRAGERCADEPLDLAGHANIKELQLMRRPYPMFF
tara:strand:- start:11913 stop:13034 length:1122 start_codon:yes stop_codon:yes gene_type:complete